MIGSLRGKVLKINLDNVLLEVQNVGYQVYLPQRILAHLAENDIYFVFIHTQVREDDITLFGFPSYEDKKIFLQLIKVSGIGAKTALNILGVLNASEIIDAISFEDKSKFTQISGIGVKAASRLINELKDKIGKIAMKNNIVSISNNKNNSLVRDALSALESLGYQKSEILDVVREESSKEDDLSIVISNCLKRLAK